MFIVTTKKIKQFIYAVFLTVFIGTTLQFTLLNNNENKESINLIWYKNYEAETWDNVKTGMLWSFSHLGAGLPKNCFEQAIHFQDSKKFTLDFSKLGFENYALKALVLICDSIKKTEDYKINNCVDLSRSLVLTTYTPRHYYKITGVNENLQNFITQYQLQKPYFFGLTKSTVGRGNRLVKFSKDTSLFNIAFIAEEGLGSLTKKTFKSEAFETIDLMHNGQLRYAIYNANGNLIESSPSVFSSAGTPTKCMWCHESGMLPFYSKNIAIKNMLNNNSFIKKREWYQTKLMNYRNSYSSEINFNNTKAHTQSEILYISFMEPSMYRLKQEFENDSLALNKIKQLQTHIYEEFPFLGNLYQRTIIDSISEIYKAKTPSSLREKSLSCINFFSRDDE